MQKEASIELVRYNTDHISKAAVALVTNFAKYSEIYGTEQWVGAIVHLLRIIENQKPQEYYLNAEGIEVSFSGFPRPRPLIREGKLVYESREPRFTIEDRLNDVLPRQRTRIKKVTEDIAHEMVNVFHLGVESPPWTLTFPKNRFAKERLVFTAPLI